LAISAATFLAVEDHRQNDHARAFVQSGRRPSSFAAVASPGWMFTAQVIVSTRNPEECGVYKDGGVVTIEDVGEAFKIGLHGVASARHTGNPS